jgi:hypothetical protein
MHCLFNAYSYYHWPMQCQCSPYIAYSCPFTSPFTGLFTGLLTAYINFLDCLITELHFYSRHALPIHCLFTAYSIRVSRFPTHLRHRSFLVSDGVILRAGLALSCSLAPLALSRPICSSSSSLAFLLPDWVMLKHPNPKSEVPNTGPFSPKIAQGLRNEYFWDISRLVEVLVLFVYVFL